MRRSVLLFGTRRVYSVAHGHQTALEHRGAAATHHSPEDEVGQVAPRRLGQQLFAQEYGVLLRAAGRGADALFRHHQGAIGAHRHRLGH